MCSTSAAFTAGYTKPRYNEKSKKTKTPPVLPCISGPVFRILDRFAPWSECQHRSKLYWSCHVQHIQLLQAVVGACERPTKAIGLVAVNDRLDSCVRARGQEQQTNKAKYDVEEEPSISTESTRLPEIYTIPLPAKSNVRHAPEDESKEKNDNKFICFDALLQHFIETQEKHKKYKLQNSKIPEITDKLSNSEL